MRDTLRQFVTLRSALESERRVIAERLAEINSALGAPAQQANHIAPRKNAPKPTRLDRSATTNGAMSMVDAIVIATKNGPLTIRELVPAIQKLGFKFISRDPINSLGAYLYGKKGRVHFRKVDRGFLSR